LEVNVGDAENKVLEERLDHFEKRLVGLETTAKDMQKDMTGLLVELKVLQTRVSLYAAAISVGVSLLVKQFS
jgi:hypothetical protein